MSFYIEHYINAWLTPPGCILLLILIGLLFWQKSRRPGKAIVWTAFFSLLFLSSPFIAQKLIDGLQYQYPALSPDKLISDKLSSIVVLEAGLSLSNPEYGQPTLSSSTLTRIRYAAFLYEKTKSPIMVSGNNPNHPSIDQTEWMASALHDYFHVPTKWKEDRGYNTAQEGIYSAKILKGDGITTVYLVTHAYHMPRSVIAFQHKGLNIIPAPTGFITICDSSSILNSILPSSEALRVSAEAIHEYIGIFWYRIK